MSNITYEITVMKVYTKEVKWDSWHDEKELADAGLTPNREGGGRYIQKSKMENVREEIYSQSVENLDIKNLIAAVNPS